MFTSAMAWAEPTGLAKGPDSLFGIWAAPCDAWGTPAECRLEWRRGLHADQLKVDYSITAKDGGKSIFSGTGIYGAGTENLEGYWSDSSGAIRPLYARWQEGVLTTHWGTAATEQGRTEYKLEKDGELHVTDWVLKPSGWHQFMRVEYQSVE
jgi:hypothetical protein